MNTERHLSSEDLDLLALGALPESERGAAEAHLGGCEACGRRRDALVRETTQYRQSVQPRLLEKTVARLESPRVRWRWPSFALLATAAAIATVVIIADRPAPAPDGYVAARGAPVFRVIVARGEARAELAPDSKLREGDRLRFLVDPTSARYVLVLSRDGAGRWSVYAPFGGEESLALDPGEQLLPGAVELDATPGREHLIAVFSDRPLRSDAVLDELRSLSWPPRGSVEIAGASAVQVRAFDKSR